MEVDAERRLLANGITVDLAAEALIGDDGTSIELRPQTFAVLRYLTKNAHRLVSKEELMRAVWPGIAVTDDSLVQCIHEIRRTAIEGGVSVGDTGRPEISVQPVPS